MQSVNLLIVMGGRIGLDKQGNPVLSPTTQLLIDGVASCYHLRNCSSVLVSGGHCLHVRYPENLDEKFFDEPNYNPEAKAKAKLLPSEAEAVSEQLKRHGVLFIISEEHSTTTPEKARQCAKIIKGMNDPDLRVGFISLLHQYRHRPNHMSGAPRLLTREFKEAGIPRQPFILLAEEMIFRWNQELAEKKIRQYYGNLKQLNGRRDPFSGRQEQIIGCLRKKQSLLKLRP